MVRVKEESNEAYLKRRVKETGGDTRKVKWIARRGAPDRLVGWPKLGRHAYVELKEETQPWGLQDHQRREIDWMNCCGMPTEIVSSKAEVDAFVARMAGLPLAYVQLGCPAPPK